MPDERHPDEDLSGPAAARKIADLVGAGDSCFFCTVGMGSQLHARPMTVMEVEKDSGQLWFFTEIDSAILLHNASTQFADGGEFGFGGEIGIATGKFHARGPVGLEQLCSFKYLVRGNGQLRP